MNFVIRKATIGDKNFIIEAIIAAEKSGSEILSYAKMLNISHAEFFEILNNILDEDIEGQDLCISGFLIAEIDGENAAAVCAWIENESGLTSSMIKTNLLRHFVDREIIIKSMPNLKLMSEIDIPRTEYALQIESCYTAEKFRGLGLNGKLIDEHIRLKLVQATKFDLVQTIILKNNTSSYRSFLKSGFVNTIERTCKNSDILNILPSDTKILLQKTIN